MKKIKDRKALKEKLQKGPCYAYMVRCADGSLYSGWTNNLEKRLAAHNAGRGAKYTRSRGPVTYAYTEAFASKEEAMSREWHLKKLSREEKLNLCRAWEEQEEKEPGV